MARAPRRTKVAGSAVYLGVAMRPKVSPRRAATTGDGGRSTGLPSDQARESLSLQWVAQVTSYSSLFLVALVGAVRLVRSLVVGVIDAIRPRR
jgi:hypothetical protein